MTTTDLVHHINSIKTICNITVPALLLFAGFSFFMADTFKRSTKYHSNLLTICMGVPFICIALAASYLGDAIAAMLLLYFYGMTIIIIRHLNRTYFARIRLWEIGKIRKDKWAPEKYYRTAGFILFMWGSSMELFGQILFSMADVTAK